MSNDFHNERRVKARKPHVCEEGGCKRTKQIEPGTVYVRQAGKFGGDFYSVTLCVRCAHLRDKAWTRYGHQLNDDEGIIFGELLEWLKESRR